MKRALRWDEVAPASQYLSLGLSLPVSYVRSKARDREVRKMFDAELANGKKRDECFLDWLSDVELIRSFNTYPAAFWKLDDPYYLCKLVAKFEYDVLPGILAIAERSIAHALPALTRYVTPEVAGHVAEGLATKKSMRKPCEAWLRDCAPIARVELGRQAKGRDAKRARWAKQALDWLEKKGKTSTASTPAKKTTGAATKGAAQDRVMSHILGFRCPNPTTKDEAKFTAKKSEKELQRILEPLRRNASPMAIADHLATYPHLAKRMPKSLRECAERLLQDLGSKVYGFADFSRWSGEQIKRKNGVRFDYHAEDLLVALALACATSVEHASITPLALRRALTAYVFGERLGSSMPFHGWPEAVAVAAIAGDAKTAGDLLGFFAAHRGDSLTRSVRPVLAALLLLTRGAPGAVLSNVAAWLDVEDERRSTIRDADERAWAEGHAPCNRALAFLARGDGERARSVLEDGATAYAVQAARLAKGGSVDPWQFVSLFGLATAARVRAAGVNVPPLPPYTIAL